MALVPRVVDAVAPGIVLAAGGISDARGLVAALAFGAAGVVMGTRFLATSEANAHAFYKEKLVAASEEDTVRTILFGNGWPNAPHRALRTGFVETWLPHEIEMPYFANEPPVGETVIAGLVMPVARFAAIPPNAVTKGDVELMELLAGQSVGLVSDIKPAGELVRDMMAGGAAHHRSAWAIGRTVSTSSQTPAVASPAGAPPGTQDRDHSAQRGPMPGQAEHFHPASAERARQQGHDGEGRRRREA